MSGLGFKLGLPGYILPVRSWLLSTGQENPSPSISLHLLLLKAKRLREDSSPRSSTVAKTNESVFIDSDDLLNTQPCRFCVDFRVDVFLQMFSLFL